MVKTSEAIFVYPVLGFTPDSDIWGFADLETLTSCGPRTLKEDMQIGMELVDARGHRWVVRSVRRIGRGEPLLKWLVSAALSTRQSRIEHELGELEPVSLAEVKRRVCASLNAFPDYYCQDDERAEVLEPLLAQVDAAPSVAVIHELLGLDSFMAY